MKDAILAKLTAADSPVRRRGVALGVDFVLDQRLSDLLDLDATRAMVVAALTEDNVGRVIERHVKPGWERYKVAVGRTNETVGSLVPEDARARIRTAIGRTRLPKGKWAHGAVEPALIRHLFAPVFADILVNFAKRIPVPGVGAAPAAGASASTGRDVGSIAGRLTRSVQKRAERLVDASRSVMGGLGAEMERRIQATAKEFSEGALGIWRDALRDRLQSPEGRELLGQISQQITDHVMMTGLSEIHEDVLKQPIDIYLDAVAPIVAHAAPRGFVKSVVDTEVAAVIEAEGNRTLRELLAEFGLLEETIAASRARVDALASAFFATEGFAEWLDDVMSS